MSPLEWFYLSSVSKVMLDAVAKLSCFKVQVIKKKKKKLWIVYRLLKVGINKKGL